MPVTITGNVAQIDDSAFGVGGIAGSRLEIRAVHPTTRPGYAFTSSVLAESPFVIALTAGGAIPSSTEILASAALRPAGAHHRATWIIPSSTDRPEQRITYDLWIGPDEGTCDITDPAHRINAGTAPVLAGWPELPPVPVYSSEGLP